MFLSVRLTLSASALVAFALAIVLALSCGGGEADRPDRPRLQGELVITYFSPAEEWDLVSRFAKPQFVVVNGRTVGNDGCSLSPPSGSVGAGQTFASHEIEHDPVSCDSIYLQGILKAGVPAE